MLICYVQLRASHVTIMQERVIFVHVAVSKGFTGYFRGSFSGSFPLPSCTIGAVQKSNSKYGNEHEAFAVYHMLRGVQKYCPIYTLCVGNAFGEAALLLSAGSPVSGCSFLALNNLRRLI